MTPSMGMAAPKGMALAAPQAGLASLAQPNAAPKGMSSGNMAQVMAMARKMSDSQLADVLQGKSIDVPQYVAMTEAMGRKSLRTAVDGAQAMAQAKQPSVKDKLMMGEQPQMPQMPQGAPQGMPQQPVMAAGGGLMYDEGGPVDMGAGQYNPPEEMGGGLASLPAPNMAPQNMAGGGIVAFSGPTGSQVEDKDKEEYPIFNVGDTLSNIGSWMGKNWEKNKAIKEGRYIDPRIEDESGRGVVTPAQAAYSAEAPQIDALAGNKPKGGPTPDEISNLSAKPKVKDTGGTGGTDKTKAGLGGTDEFGSYMDTIKKNNADYLSKLEGMGTKQREGLAKLKSQGGGEALMNLAGALFGNPNMSMAMGQGMPALAKSAAASRKEQQTVEQAANDYDLNLAKAQESAAKGDMEAALKFKQLAQEAKYQQGMLSYHNAALNKPGESMQLLEAIRKPGESLSDAYARMQTLKKPTDVIPRATALKEWGDLLPNAQRKYGTFENYYNTVNSTSGGGNSYQSAADAEMKRRGI